MASIHDNVFDAALEHIKSNCDQVQCRTSASSVLVSVSSGIDASDFGSPANWSSGSSAGRAIQCLKSSAVASQAVSSGGSIAKVALMDQSPAADLVVASISGSPVNVGSSDQVTITAFSVILKDPA